MANPSAAQTGPNVSIPRCCKYGRSSQFAKHTGRYSLTFGSYFSWEISFYTYLYTIYIKFI